MQQPALRLAVQPFRFQPLRGRLLAPEDVRRVDAGITPFNRESPESLQHRDLFVDGLRLLFQRSIQHGPVFLKIQRRHLVWVEALPIAISINL